MVVLLPLSFSLLVTSLTLDLKIWSSYSLPDQTYESQRDYKERELEIFKLLSTNRNLTFSRRGLQFYVDSMHIANFANGSTNTIEMRCVNDVSLRISVQNTAKYVKSPSLCQQSSKNSMFFF